MSAGRIPTTANSPLTAKGDLFGYSTQPARLAVGSDGDTIVADSSTSTGLRYTALFGANKNKIINGDFYVNQRNFTSGAANNDFNFDRWQSNSSGGTVTTTASTFTLGAAPVAGYEGRNFLTVATSGQTTSAQLTLISHKIESVRNFANQTMTVSFWAKANTGTPKIAFEVSQNFGTGGSPSAAVNTYAGQVTISTSWARYSITIAVPSISGKTIGTNNNDSLNLFFWYSAGSDYNARTGSIGLQNATIDIWGVQAEAGSVATAFQTATGTLQGELAACQRYYYRSSGTAAYSPHAQGIAAGASDFQGIFQYPVTMRVAPTSVHFSNLGLSDGVNAPVAITTLAMANNTTSATLLNSNTAGGLTQYRYYQILNNNSTSGFLGVSAEL